MSSKKIQRSLYNALTSTAFSEFDLSRFMVEQSISRKQVVRAAHGVLSRYCVHYASDGEVTDEEMFRIRRLAAALEIPPARCDAILKGAKEKVVHEEQSKALADGVITDKEQAALDQLRDSLGLPPPRPSAVVSEQSAIVAAPVTQNDWTKTLCLQATGTPNSLLAELSVMESVDKDFEEKERFWKKMTGIFAILAFVCFLCVFLVAKLDEDVAWYFLVIAVPVCLALAIASSAMRRHCGRLNVDDRRYLIAGELLRHLKHDMDADSEIELGLDLNSYHQSAYRTSKKGFRLSPYLIVGAAVTALLGAFNVIGMPLVVGGVALFLLIGLIELIVRLASATNESSYLVPWLSIKGRLVDGSRLRFCLSQLVKRKERRRRKYTKVKVAFREKISLLVQVRPKAAGALVPFQEQMERASLPTGIERPRVQVKGNRVVLQTVTSMHRQVRRAGAPSSLSRAAADQRTSDHHTHLQLLLACFDSLGRCRGTSQ